MSGAWFWLPLFGPIRISTVIVAAAMFAVILVVRRDPVRALVAVIAWTSAFETVYNFVGVAGFHWPIPAFAWATAALAGWVVLAAVLGIWPDWRFVAAFVLLMVAWVATGFHSNVAGQPLAIDVRDEVLNEASKTTLALAYLTGALRAGARSRGSEQVRGQEVQDLAVRADLVADLGDAVTFVLEDQ